MNELVAVGDQGQQLQNLNKAEMVIQSLPEKLALLEYDHLRAWHQALRDLEVIRWRVQLAVLAEGFYRIENGGVEGTQAKKQLAQDFGISASYAYRKVQIWKTFWQDPSVENRVEPNGNHWVFQDLTSGYIWFNTAMKADDPIAAIEMAQEKWEEAKGDPDIPDYTPSMFAREISKTEDPESNRLGKISKELERAFKHISELSDEDDLSAEYVEGLANHIDQMGKSVNALREHSESGSLRGDELRYEDGMDINLAPDLNTLIRLLNSAITIAQTLAGEGFDSDKEDLLLAVGRVAKALPSLVQRLEDSSEG
jgi:hypothetical protein